MRLPSLVGRPSSLPRASVDRRTRAIEVTAMTDPRSSDRYGPYHAEFCAAAPSGPRRLPGSWKRNHGRTAQHSMARTLAIVCALEHTRTRSRAGGSDRRPQSYGTTLNCELLTSGGSSPSCLVFQDGERLCSIFHIAPVTNDRNACQYIPPPIAPADVEAF